MSEASLSVGHARGMQNVVVQPDRQTDDAARTAATSPVVQKGENGPSSSLAAAAAEPTSVTRRDIHTAFSVNAQRPRTKEGNLVHQAALRRSAGNSSTPHPHPLSQPTLVHPAPPSPAMKKKQAPQNRNASPKIPPPESFSFQDILASIGPDADAAIDAIAEICGRSKMSLADEHGSHMPPQGEVDALPMARLETLSETSSNIVQTRSMTRRLRDGEAVPSSPTAATSDVTSHRHVGGDGHRRSRSSVSLPAAQSMVPQVLAWLRGSKHSGPGQDVGAVNALQRLLHDRTAVE